MNVGVQLDDYCIHMADLFAYDSDRDAVRWSVANERMAKRVEMVGQPHTLSWRSATADDAEWMSGKSRDRLAPTLTGGSSWMSDRRTL